MDQAWRFFLNCNRDVPLIVRTWENHEYLRSNDDDDRKDQHDEAADARPRIHAVTLFRSLFTSLSQKGARVSVAREDFICDPINGNLLVEVELKKVLPSNARPLLVDCYTFGGGGGGDEANRRCLSSRMLLKQGAALRKVMMMHKMHKICKMMRSQKTGLGRDADVQVHERAVAREPSDVPRPSM